MPKFFRPISFFLTVVAVQIVLFTVPTAIAQVSRGETNTRSRAPIKIEVESDYFELFSISPIRQWKPTGTEETEQCIWVYGDKEPNPYSHFLFVLIAECKAGFSYEFRDTTGAVLHSLDVPEVEPGWYGVTGRRPFPNIAGKWQVESSGEVAKEWAGK